MSTPKDIGHSIQDVGTSHEALSDMTITAGQARWLMMQIAGTYEKAPPYWSKTRDDWLVEFVKAEGNDLLAGAVSTVTAKVVANNWYVEGPLLLAGVARDQLLYWSAFGGGWNMMVSPAVEGFLNRDMGGLIELHRASASDLEGPAMGYSHLDESKCYPTKDPEYPFKYASDRGTVKVHRSQVAQLVDMPSGQDRYRGVGYCSVSRAVTIALTLQQVAKYKREKLSNLPPAGIMLINNLGEQEWADLTAKYDTRQTNVGNTVFQNVMFAFGVDPAYPLQAELIEFSALPDHFNEKEFTEMTVYSFAMAFREDPREFWPVSTGPLGTATEAELQARSARLKGEGIIATAIERKLNRSEALPPEVAFHFDFQDDEQDMLSAQLHDLKSQTIRRFWEPPTGSSAEVGIITSEQARAWAVRERIIPADILAQPMDLDRIYDTKSWRNYKGFGPQVRLYNTGVCWALERNEGIRWRS